ncbi:Carboxylesterase NlhH [Piscirickettsia salmonis]|uniref:alpha/beta hydrolase n=1 Tax=Piscirickettsia salmonis TaxID=1238 RepID=UPI0012BA8BD7|nr:alpha/beta hydrolase [Piscirickettsia salmonis]QGO67814.1 Carboxylesterase NlhH [Piscirickettsia salmonis]
MIFDKSQTPFAEFLNYINNNRIVELSPDILRAAFSKLCQNLSIPHEELYQVESSTIHTHEYNIPTRTYLPIEHHHTLPIMIYLHGGGHMIGSINDYDTTLRAIANHCQAVVIAIEYRLAPEHPYPAGLNDCLCAIEHLSRRFDQRNIYIAGDSAGGNLTALATLKLHDNINIAGQILIYPSLDFSCSSPSYHHYQQYYFLERKTIEFYFNHYFNSPDQSERIAASPLLQPTPSTLPKTLIITADLDPLRDEGIRYHQKLQEHRIHAELTNIPKMIHAFMSLYKVVPKQVEQLFTLIYQFINDNNHNHHK